MKNRESLTDDHNDMDKPAPPIPRLLHHRQRPVSVEYALLGMLMVAVIAFTAGLAGGQLLALFDRVEHCRSSAVWSRAALDCP